MVDIEKITAHEDDNSSELIRRGILLTRILSPDVADTVVSSGTDRDKTYRKLMSQAVFGGKVLDALVAEGLVDAEELEKWLEQGGIDA